MSKGAFNGNLRKPSGSAKCLYYYYYTLVSSTATMNGVAVATPALSYTYANLDPGLM